MNQTQNRDAIEASLARLCNDPKFSRSRRSVTLLRYLVEKTLSGREDEIKEYSVGVEALGRTADFDPRVDTAVRVEMTRLRARLDAYYKNDGATDPVRIFIPVGQYLPRFEFALSPDNPPSVLPSPDNNSRSRRTLPWRLALPVIIGLGLLGTLLLWRKSTDLPNIFGPADEEKYLPPGPFRVYPSLAPDGSWMVFASDDTPDGQLQLWRENKGSDSPKTLLTRDACPKTSPVISPDGAWIAYRKDCNPGGVYLIGSQSPGEPRLIAHFGRDPYFSPDGRSLVYWVEDPVTRFGTVYVAPLTRPAEPMPIAREFEDAHSSIWTAEPNRILICGTRRSLGGPAEEHDLWLVEPSDAQGNPGRFIQKLGVFDALKRNGVAIAHDALSASNFTWSGRTLFLAVRARDGQQLWKIRFDGAWKMTRQPEKVLASGAAIAHPAATRGELAYSKITHTTHLWELPLDSNRGVPAGPLNRLSAEHGLSPSASRDGSTVAFLSPPGGDSRADQFEIRRLPPGGRSAPLPSLEGLTRRMLISPDGKYALYRVMVPDGPFARQAIYEYNFAAARSNLVCRDCGAPTSITSDGGVVVYEAPNTLNRLGAYRRATGEKWEFLEHPAHGVGTGAISPNQKWIAFSENAMRDGQHISVAPFSLAAGKIHPDKWIPVDRSGARNEQPQWSPDGRLIYYLSDADGWWCIRARRFNPDTGQLLGLPFDVFHFHSFRLNPSRLTNQPRHLIGFTVTARSAILALNESAGQIEKIQIP